MYRGWHAVAGSPRCSSPTRATGRLCRAGPGLSRSRLLPASALRIRARTQWSVVVRCGRFVCARRRFRLFVYGFDGFRPDRTPPPRPRVPVRRSQSATLAQAHTCADRAHAKPPVPSRAPSPAPHSSQPIVRNSTPCMVTITKERPSPNPRPNPPKGRERERGGSWLCRSQSPGRRSTSA